MANYDLTMVPSQAGNDGPPTEMTTRGIFKLVHKGEKMKAVWGYNATKNIAGVIYVPEGETVTTFRIVI